MQADGHRMSKVRTPKSVSTLMRPGCTRSWRSTCFDPSQRVKFAALFSEVHLRPSTKVWRYPPCRWKARRRRCTLNAIATLARDENPRQRPLRLPCPPASSPLPRGDPNNRFRLRRSEASKFGSLSIRSPHSSTRTACGRDSLNWHRRPSMRLTRAHPQFFAFAVSTPSQFSNRS